MPAPKAKAKAKAKKAPVSRAKMDASLAAYEKAFDDFKDRYEASLEAYQVQLNEGLKRYEQLLDQMIEQVQPAEQPQPEETPPAAVWTDAPDGEKLLILNQNAAVMFMAIFDRLDEVLQEIQKIAGKR